MCILAITNASIHVVICVPKQCSRKIDEFFPFVLKNFCVSLVQKRFAAEIFHDLHEDVMATASRGHGLMLRMQQLEAEFPAVEKAIIAQTDHSNYLHDDG